MTQTCRKCGMNADDYCLICPHCNAPFTFPESSNPTDYVSSGTTISGSTFTVSSATVVSPSWSKITEQYKNSTDKAITAEQFSRKKISENTLDYYVNIGYLELKSGNQYKLTELGKKILYKNLEFQQKIKENIEKINLGD
jgi:hypothetical protein